MKNSRLLKFVIVFIFCLNESFAQVSTYTASPQSVINCSLCAGDTWTLQGSSPVLYSTTLGGVSSQLYMTNFGFNIPSSATILGISLSVSTWSCMPEKFYDSSVRLMVNNVPVGSNKALLTNFLQYNYNNTSYGGPTDLWGNILSPLIINDLNFGAAYEVTHTINAFSCFQLNGPISPTVYNPFPIMEVYYMLSTGLIQSQKSNIETVKIYSHDHKMYINNSTSEIIENATIQIYNALGEVILEEQKTIAPNEIENLVLSNPSNGFYFVTISSNKKELIFSKKVLIDSN